MQLDNGLVLIVVAGIAIAMSILAAMRGGGDGHAQEHLTFRIGIW